MKAETFSKDGIVYVRINDTKVYRLEVLLKETKQHAIADEVRDNASIKRRVARAMTDSIDMPESRASRADVADYRPLERLISYLDEPTAMYARSQRLLHAYEIIRNALNLKIVDDRRELWRILSLVAYYKSEAKPHVMNEFKMPERTYQWRIKRYAEILEAAQRGSYLQGG